VEEIKIYSKNCSILYAHWYKAHDLYCKQYINLQSPLIEFIDPSCRYHTQSEIDHLIECIDGLNDYYIYGYDFI
jgi:hypothetical protein